MDPFVAFAAGVGVSVVLGSVGAWVYRRKAPEIPLSTGPEDSSDFDAAMLALYEVQPDGIYAWVDGEAASEQCTPALEELLQLPRGSVTKFERVAEVFAASESVLLNQAAGALRSHGETFDLLLPLSERMVHVIGRRARETGGKIVGDITWFRDVSALAFSPDTTGAEDHMRAVFDAMPIPVWLRDPDLELAFTNSLAGAAGNAVARRATEIATKAANEGGVQTERRMLDVDGSRRVLEITEASLGHGGGTVGFAVEHVGGDVDEMKAAMARHRTVFDHMLGNLSAGIVVYGPDKRIETHNAAFGLMWEMDETWLEERPSLSQVLDHMRESRLAEEVPDFNRYRAEENALFDVLEGAEERTQYLPDRRTLKVTVAPAGGGGLTYIYEDISDSLDLQRSYKTLDLVQRHTIDNLQEAVAVFGSDARLKLHNAPFAALWRLDETEAEPLLSEIVEHMREPDMDDGTWDEQRQSILANLSQRREHRARFRHGSDKVYDVACIPLPDGATLISYLDITDEAQVAHALRERAQMAEETSQLKSKFIDDVSYEVRTPLTTITGFSEILTAEYFGELNARQREYLIGIQATADTLMSVVADILELAAIEGGTAKLEKDAVDLHAMLAQCIKLITERARQKEINLSFDVPTDIGWLSADPKRLRQVIFNLLANAVRFTPNRGGVRLSAERDDNDVILSIADTGVGIPQADIDRVFGKFAKGDQPPKGATGEPDGAGLGLAMVKSFVELHGGTVEIVSPRNRGTTVTCRLPATGTEGGDARDAFEHG
jgi:signal transduction histidine kinase